VNESEQKYFILKPTHKVSRGIWIWLLDLL